MNTDALSNGFFITIEGIDGTGKSSQLQILIDALRNHGYDTHFTKEPGDSRFGSRVGAGVRRIIFGDEPGSRNLAPGVADILFLADHVQNVYDIGQALKQGKVVVSDRYADSQFAYAVVPERKSTEFSLKAYSEQFGIVPDLTILILSHGPDENPEDISWALDRANRRTGSEAGKQQGKEWNINQIQIQTAYLSQIGSDPRTVKIWIRESDSIEKVHQLIWTAVRSRLNF
jgi:dTMP kinase